MLGKIFFLLCFGVAGKLFAQDSSWKVVKVDENLTLSLPENLTITDTPMVTDGKKFLHRIIKAETDNSILRVTVTSNGTDLNVDNTEALRSMLNDIAKGFCEKAKSNGYLCMTSDTVVDGTPGKKLKMYGPSAASQAITNFGFLIDQKLYMITATCDPLTSDPEKFEREINIVLRSINFPETTTKERNTGSKLLLAIFLLVIIGVSIYLFRRK